jgi:hypothetical protein
MLTNECCTLFLKSGNGFERYFVASCHWQESKASNVLKSGMASADGIAVYIFIKDISEELKALLTARKSAAQDLIVFGECNFTFDNSTPQSASESLRELNASFDAHTVMSIDKLLYGSPEMQHFKLSAR